MKKNKKKEIITDLLIVVIVFTVFFVITKFLCTFINVKGTSMQDTLQENDKGMSFYYDLDNIQRFDIVVVNTESEKSLIKRVIGLPNEKIEYRDNKLYVNGEYIKEEFLKDGIITNNFNITLKDNEYFCLGDNRGVSNDSRFYGPFKKENIETSHIFILYPFNRIGFIK